MARYLPKVDKFTTKCCALSQLRADNRTTMAAIKRTLAEIKERAKNPKDNDAYEMGKGETTVFIVTMPNEQELEKKLIKIGFKCMFEFKRRTSTIEQDKRIGRENPEGKLKYWLYSIIK